MLFFKLGTKIGLLVDIADFSFYYLYSTIPFSLFIIHHIKSGFTYKYIWCR